MNDSIKISKSMINSIKKAISKTSAMLYRGITTMYQIKKFNKNPKCTHIAMHGTHELIEPCAGNLFIARVDRSRAQTYVYNANEHRFILMPKRIKMDVSISELDHGKKDIKVSCNK